MPESSGEHEVSAMVWSGFPDVQDSLTLARTFYFRSVASLLYVRQPGCIEDFLGSALNNMNPVYNAFQSVLVAEIGTARTVRCLRSIFTTEIEARRKFYPTVSPQSGRGRDFRFSYFGSDLAASTETVRGLVTDGNALELVARLTKRHFQDVEGVLEMAGISLQHPAGDSTIGEELAVRKLAMLSLDTPNLGEGT